MLKCYLLAVSVTLCKMHSLVQWQTFENQLLFAFKKLKPKRATVDHTSLIKKAIIQIYQGQINIPGIGVHLWKCFVSSKILILIICLIDILSTLVFPQQSISNAFIIFLNFDILIFLGFVVLLISNGFLHYFSTLKWSSERYIWKDVFNLFQCSVILDFFNSRY